MRPKYILAICVACFLALPGVARAQWTNPRLLASQAAFNIAASFIGKVLLKHEPPGRALKKALVEGTASGLVAHTGYCIAGRHPHVALAGKALAQKSALMTRRSIHGKPVFDQSLYSHWQITHSLIQVEITDTPRVSIDVLNSVVGAYYIADPDLNFDLTRTLYSGALFFRNENNQSNLKGLSAPGAIWIDNEHYDDFTVFGHEIIHTLQNERGSATVDWHYKNLRFNILAFAPGVPALLKGWPSHDKRLHEREADQYAGRE